MCKFVYFANSTLQNSRFLTVFLLVSKICRTFAAYTTDYSFIISFFTRSQRLRAGVFLFNIFAYIKNFQYLCSVFHS